MSLPSSLSCASVAIPETVSLGGWEVCVTATAPDPAVDRQMDRGDTDRRFHTESMRWENTCEVPAGQDTVTLSICWRFHLLSWSPDYLSSRWALWIWSSSHAGLCAHCAPHCHPACACGLSQPPPPCASIVPPLPGDRSLQTAASLPRLAFTREARDPEAGSGAPRVSFWSQQEEAGVKSAHLPAYQTQGTRRCRWGQT